MASNEKTRLLCVDDEPNVLSALQRQFRKQYDVVTAGSGRVGLDLIKSEAPFEVIISDMRMPEMNGATFLKAVHELTPDTVRVLLTGQSDLNDAVAAVNDGKIFRFLRKPCAPDELSRAIADAAEQHRLVTAERVLLEQTLFGSIKTLTDILALANPTAFGRSNRAKRLATELISHLEVDQRWQIEVAAMLSQIGSMTLPAEIAEKTYHGRELTPSEAHIVERMPLVAAKLLANIPRLDGVRDILRYQDKRYDGSGLPKDLVSGDEIPFGARVLKLVLDFDMLETQGVSLDVALGSLKGRSGWYDPRLLEAFIEVRGKSAREAPIRELCLSEILPGMVFVEDVVSTAGTLLISRGQEVTASLYERIRNFSRNTAVREPLRVIVPKRAVSKQKERSDEPATTST